MDTITPRSLVLWFKFHGIIDLLIGIPLFFDPHSFLTFLRWPVIDPFASRLVAAALLSIGVVSLSIKESHETYKALTFFKIFWSFFAITGISSSLSFFAFPFFAYIILLTFGFFFFLWTYYYFHIFVNRSK